MQDWYSCTWLKGQLFIAFHILQYSFEFWHWSLKTTEEHFLRGGGNSKNLWRNYIQHPENIKKFCAILVHHSYNLSYGLVMLHLLVCHLIFLYPSAFLLETFFHRDSGCLSDLLVFLWGHYQGCLYTHTTIYKVGILICSYFTLGCLHMLCINIGTKL